MDNPLILVAIVVVLLLVVCGVVFVLRARSATPKDVDSPALEPSDPQPNPPHLEPLASPDADPEPISPPPKPAENNLPTFKNHSLEPDDPPEPTPEPATPALFDAPLFPGDLDNSEMEGDPTLAMNSAELFSALSNPNVPVPSKSPAGAVPSFMVPPHTEEEDEGDATQALDTMTLQHALAKSLGGVKESLSSTTLKARNGPSTRSRLSSLPNTQNAGSSGSAWSVGGQSGMHQLPSTLEPMESGFGRPSPSSAAISIVTPTAAESSATNELQGRLASLRKQLNTFDQGGAASEAMSALVDEKSYKSSLRPGGTAFDMPTRRVSGDEIDAAVSSSASVEDQLPGAPPSRGTMLGMPGIGQDLKALNRQTYDALKAAPSVHGQPRTPFSEAIGSMLPEAINQLWVEYVEANHNVGRDVSRLKSAVFFKHLSQNHRVICEKYNCTRVKFGIKTTGNKVSLQAVPIRNS